MWTGFCNDNRIDLSEPTVKNELDFLATLFHQGLGYSAINTARSALSTVITTQNDTTFGKHPLVCAD